MRILETEPQPLKQQVPQPLPQIPANRRCAVLEYLPQVREIARRIHDHLPAQVPLDNLIDAGVIGLIEAVENLDLSESTHIKFYVMFRVRAAILDEVGKMDWSPRHLRRQTRYLDEARREPRLQHKSPQSAPQSRSESTICLEEFRQLLGDMRALSSDELQRVPQNGRSQITASATQARTADQDPLVLCLREEIKLLATDALSGLDERSRVALSLYYLEELTTKEVATVLGVSETIALQVHSAGLSHMRLKLENILDERHCSVSTSAF